MPIHDWTRVSAGTWHDFHHVWIAEIRTALNDGLLPDNYYAQSEGLAVADAMPAPDDRPVKGGISVKTVPPRTRFVFEADEDDYARKRSTLVIRHASGDRVVALIEILSPGNKSSQHAWRDFVEKAAQTLTAGCHLLLVDLFPPGARDPQGVHGALWSEFSDEVFELPPGEPLTLAAYSAGPPKRAYVEPTAVGRELIDMPLFLAAERYINVPLEATYQAAYRGVPKRWQQVLDAA